jgi:DNA-3-methyladenine glycosylase
VTRGVTATRGATPAHRATAARRLNAAGYGIDAVTLAPALLGKLLCRRLPAKSPAFPGLPGNAAPTKNAAAGGIVRLRITETEAYYGEGDTACHASRGKTERTAVMYRAGGFAYVYLCYGVHWMLNVVSGPADFPEAVLIRGVEGFDGPGKLTKALDIGKDLKGENLLTSQKLWIEDDGYTPLFRRAKRVGIDYAAAKDKNRLWRFIVIG